MPVLYWRVFWHWALVGCFFMDIENFSMISFWHNRTLLATSESGLGRLILYEVGCGKYDESNSLSLPSFVQCVRRTDGPPRPAIQSGNSSLASALESCYYSVDHSSVSCFYRKHVSQPCGEPHTAKVSLVYHPGEKLYILRKYVQLK